MNDPDLRRLAMEWRIIGAALSRITRVHVEQRLQRLGADISGLQMGVLKVLQHSGDNTLSDLSKKMVLDPSTLVPTIDGLERKGYVFRQRDPQDRRRVQISLTPDGAECVRRIEVIDDDDLIYQAFVQMGQERASQLLTLLRQMIHCLPDGEQLLRDIEQHISAFRSSVVPEPSVSTIHQEDEPHAS
ncbi:MAG: MarR family winged helix-turn-helix transcriptional regulator [Anaerolineae bacterium]|nr:MarR family winged helix-turn-helix transcriptional regulator [Anaerolineae bacterium]MDW8170865.1 MarR family winged helix-turn-helix transcriptional regulator [Anaerolineae bacterium]